MYISFDQHKVFLQNQLYFTEIIENIDFVYKTSSAKQVKKSYSNYSFFLREKNNTKIFLSI